LGILFTLFIKKTTVKRFWNISPAEPGQGVGRKTMITTKINQPFFHRVSDEHLKGLQRRFSFFLWPSSQACRWTTEVAHASHVSENRVLEMVIPVFIWII